jgi:hypothetical protein
MTTLPPSVKLRVYIGACGAWIAAGVWLVGCFVVAAPVRVGVGAALSVVLLGIAVGFVKHDLEMDAIRSRGAQAEPVFFDPRDAK